MSRISVNEDARKPKRKLADNLARKDRAERKKRYDQGKDIQAEQKREGIPRAVRAARLAVRLNPAPEVVGEQCECGHTGWKWQTECARCGKPLGR